MSHIVTIKTDVRNAVAIDAACGRLKLDQPEVGKFKLFSGEASGLAVRLPGWRYPLVCNNHTGELCYDNYGGAWKG